MCQCALFVGSDASKLMQLGSGKDGQGGPQRITNEQIFVLFRKGKASCALSLRSKALVTL